MLQGYRSWTVAFVAALGLLTLIAPTVAVVAPEVIEWELIPGNVVRFHVGWHDPDPVNPSLPFSGEMFSQEFGAFLPHYGLIGTIDVPPIEPESCIDVFLEVPLSSLPPSPGWRPGPSLSRMRSHTACPPPDDSRRAPRPRGRGRTGAPSPCAPAGCRDSIRPRPARHDRCETDPAPGSVPRTAQESEP